MDINSYLRDIYIRSPKWAAGAYKLLDVISMQCLRITRVSSLSPRVLTITQQRACRHAFCQLGSTKTAFSQAMISGHIRAHSILIAYVSKGGLRAVQRKNTVCSPANFFVS